MSRDQLEVLFKQYEAAFDKLDLKAISGYCADSFISAGPKGSIESTPEFFCLYIDWMTHRIIPAFIPGQTVNLSL